MGKHKPIYDPSTDCGDYVVAVGCKDLRTTGKKRFQKKYYTHTTRPGSLKSMTMDKMFEKWGGGEVLRRAVRGMLPKNRLREKRLARLKSEFCSPPLNGFRACLPMLIIFFLSCSVRRSQPSVQGEHYQVWQPVRHRKLARGSGDAEESKSVGIRALEEHIFFPIWQLQRYPLLPLSSYSFSFCVAFQKRMGGVLG